MDQQHTRRRAPKASGAPKTSTTSKTSTAPKKPLPSGCGSLISCRECGKQGTERRGSKESKRWLRVALPPLPDTRDCNFAEFCDWKCYYDYKHPYPPRGVPDIKYFPARHQIEHMREVQARPGHEHWRKIAWMETGVRPKDPELNNANTSGGNTTSSKDDAWNSIPTWAPNGPRGTRQCWADMMEVED